MRMKFYLTGIGIDMLLSKFINLVKASFKIIVHLHS